MKKEYLIVAVVGLVVFGYIVDYISGPVAINMANPFLFLDEKILSIYPLTAVSIAAKTLAVVIFVPLLLSVVNRKYLMKTGIVFGTSAIMVLYSIQQLATGQRFTSIQWTLSLAFAGVGLFIPLAYYLLAGLLKGTKKILGDDSDESFEL